MSQFLTGYCSLSVHPSILTFLPPSLSFPLFSGQVTYSVIFQEIWHQSAIMTAVRFLPSSISGVRESRSLGLLRRVAVLSSFITDVVSFLRPRFLESVAMGVGSAIPLTVLPLKARLVGGSLLAGGSMLMVSFCFLFSHHQPDTRADLRLDPPFYSSPSRTILRPTGSSSSSVSPSVQLVSETKSSVDLVESRFILPDPRFALS